MQIPLNFLVGFFYDRLFSFLYGLMMNKFIGGSLDESDFYIENFERDVFYLTNIDTMQKEKYLKTQFHKNGLTYTFWIFEPLDESIKAKRIIEHMVNI